MASTPMLVNLNNQAPVFHHEEPDLKVSAFVAQDIHMFEKYVSRKNDYFETGGSSVLYFITVSKNVDEGLNNNSSEDDFMSNSAGAAHGLNNPKNVKNNKIVKEFVFHVPTSDKRFVKFWSKEQWLTIAALNEKKVDLLESLAEVQSAMSSMSYFSEIRKLAKIKRNGLKKDIAAVEKEISAILMDASTRGNQRIIFDN